MTNKVELLPRDRRRTGILVWLMIGPVIATGTLVIVSGLAWVALRIGLGCVHIWLDLARAVGGG